MNRYTLTEAISDVADALRSGTDHGSQMPGITIAA